MKRDNPKNKMKKYDFLYKFNGIMSDNTDDVLQ